MDGMRNRSRGAFSRWALACAALAAESAASAADAGSFRAGIGYDYTSGSYGGPQTITETYVPVSGAYRLDQFELRVTVPYVSVSGPATIIDDATGEFAPGPGGTHSGLGDVILGATLYDVLRSESAQFSLDVAGKLKFGTASASKGLGTGETDYSLQVDALKEIGDFGLFGTAGYVVRGSPGVLKLRDVPFGAVGGDLRVSDAARAGLSYSYRPSAIEGYQAVQQAALFVIFAPGNSFTIRPYVSAGFGDSSPSWGAGIALSWKFDTRGFTAW